MINQLRSPYARIVDTPAITRVLVLITLAGSFLIGAAFWIVNGLKETAVSLFAVTLVSAILLILLKAGYYRLSGLVLYLIVSLVLTFNISIGHAIFDEAMVAIPLLIIFSGLIFGKRASILVTAISLGELILVYILAQAGYVRPFGGALEVPLEETITTLVILAASGVLVWVVIDVIEKEVLQIQRSEEELEKAYDLTLSAWAKALELRERESPGHSERVTALAVRLAQEMGLDPVSVQQVRQGALLHDIGKMGIPEKLLLKPGPYHPEEKELLSKHIEMAVEIILKDVYLKGALEIIRCHHERHDGSGYPAGLSGEDIPLGARIFSIVDTWDMMRTARPCRPAINDRQAIEFIQEQSDRKFHPDVVSTFLALVRSSINEDLVR